MRNVLIGFVALLSVLAGGLCFGEIPVVGVTPVRGADVPKEPTTPVATVISKEIKTLTRQLLDANRTDETRYDAAEMLLRRNTPAAQNTLLKALSEAARVESQTAAAKALASAAAHGMALKPYQSALWRLVREDQTSATLSAAGALAANPSAALLETLHTAIRTEKTLPLETRAHITVALARHINQRNLAQLIDLLQNDSPVIRAAAAESLQQFTTVKGLGQNHAKWTQWSRRYVKLTAEEFLRDMLVRRHAIEEQLRKDNAALLARLVQARKDLFNASPAERKPDLAAEMLSDPIEEIRMLGAQLTATLLAGEVQLPYRLQRRVHGLLHDESVQLRSAGAALEAALGDKRAPQRLLITLQSETNPAVRVALLEALGHLANPTALKSVLKAVSSPSHTEAKAAADAIGRILRAAPPKNLKSIAAILDARYSDRDPANPNTPELREALLEAIAATALPSGSKRMILALKDRAAVVRLAALNGLRQLQTKTAAKAIAPLVADPDRGVRLAAVGALAQLAGMDYFKTIFQRTKPAVEDNGEVRKVARDALMGLFREANAKILAEGINLLDEDRETLPLKIELLRLYVQRQRTAQAASLPADLRRLGKALGQHGEYAESATALLEAYQLLQKTADTPDQKSAIEAVWGECLLAMLAGSDPAFAQFLASPPAKPLFDVGYGDLVGRLDALRKAKQYLPIVTLCDSAQTRLTSQLSPSRKRQLQSLRQWATNKQAAVDAQQIKSLLGSLLSADLDTRDEAIKAIKPLGRRAIAPLLDQLDAKLKETPAAPRDEGILFDLLRQIEPAVGEYDPAAKLETKTALIKTLRKKFAK